MAIARLDSASSSTSTSFSYTVSSGTDRLLVVTVMAGAGSGTPNVSGITYGGQSLTEALRNAYDNIDVEIWYLDDAGIAAASGSTVSVSYSSGQDEDSYAAASYTGVDQTTPVSETNSDGNGGSPNPATGHDVTEADGNLVVSAGCVEGVGSQTWHSDLTEQTGFTGGNISSSMADRLSSTGGNVSCELTWGSSGTQSLVSVEFAQASGGGGSVVPIIHQQHMAA